MDSLTAEIIGTMGVPGLILVIFLGMYRKEIWGGITGGNANKGMESLFAKNLEHFRSVDSRLGEVHHALEEGNRLLGDILGAQRKLLEESIRQGARK